MIRFRYPVDTDQFQQIQQHHLLLSMAPYSSKNTPNYIIHCLSILAKIIQIVKISLLFCQ